jgi:regulator of protease activity HflC (stomatin/prohibitin superfamily)
VGLSDNAALESTYAVSDPESLIREAASSLVLRYFNSRTLEEVLGARRENVAGTLRSALTEQINTYHAGIDIVSVLIEEIHPPAGAAEAYHAVQAAQINANASIADERGRAERTAGVAQQEAHQLLASATGQATEVRDAATADAYRFQADERAYQKSGRSFLLERLYSNLAGALRSKPLTIMDHRLSANDGPIIDLRPPSAAPAVGPASAPAAPAATPPAEPVEEPAFSTAD